MVETSYEVLGSIRIYESKRTFFLLSISCATNTKEKSKKEKKDRNGKERGRKRLEKRERAFYSTYICRIARLFCRFVSKKNLLL